MVAILLRAGGIVSLRYRHPGSLSDDDRVKFGIATVVLHPGRENQQSGSLNEKRQLL